MIYSTPSSGHKLAGRNFNWFVMDELANPTSGYYRVLPFDKDNDLVDEVGGVSFERENYYTQEDAKKAFDDAVAKCNNSCYPPVRVEIVRVVQSGKVVRKETQVNWS